MKKCPNCGETLGDRVVSCFNCSYNFNYKRVVTKDELVILEKEREEEIRQYKKDFEEEQKRLLSINDLYEYETAILTGNSIMPVDPNELRNVINDYAKEGWRLVSSYSNTSRRRLYETGVPDETFKNVLLFERCIFRCDK